jgi:hypothetical protein
MSTRAVGFMHKWVGANVVDHGYASNKGIIAGALIARCQEELAAAGISASEVIEDFDMTIESYVIDALENAQPAMSQTRGAVAWRH